MLDTLPPTITVRRPPAHARCSVELADAIAAQTEKGVYVEYAAGMHGVDPLRFREWLRRGRVEWEEYEDCDEPPESVSVYCYMFLTILIAESRAKGSAEVRTYRAKPDVWLLKGPASRGTWGDGTGSAASVSVNVTQQQVNMTLQPPQMTEQQLLEVAGILQEIGVLPAPTTVESVPATPPGDPADE